MEMTDADKKPKPCKEKCPTAEKKPKEKKPKEKEPKEKESQNGKGDSPRNISPEFRDNYAEINWSKKA